DQRAAARGEPADLAQRVRADEHAAPGGGGRRLGRVVAAREGIEQLEEEHERGAEEPFPERLARELGHQRDERRVALTLLREQGGNRAWRELDVGVEQQRVR